MHPLYNLNIELCLPFLDPVVGVARRQGLIADPSAPKEQEEHKGLADADGLKDDRTDLELQLDGERGPDEPLFDFFLEDGEDAMTRLGYGVVSYFGLIYTFMLVFAMITALNVPVMYMNSQWTAYEQYRQMSWWAQFTVGNLGASEARCLNVKMVSESISVACNTGSITNITHYGLYKKDSEADQRGLCTSASVSVNTGLDCPEFTKKDSAFFTDKLSTCIGQQSCLLHDIHSDIPLGNSGPGCDISDQDSLFI